MTLGTYAHLFDERDENRHTSAEALIVPPGRLCVSRKDPFCVRLRPAPPTDFSAKPLQMGHGRSRTRTWDLFLIREAL